MALADLVKINLIEVKHARTNEVWKIVENENSNGFLEKLTFDESIFGSIPSGFIIARDPGDMIADFNFTGKDNIKFEIVDRVGITLSVDDYYIYQVSRATDYTDRTQPRMVVLKFVHESYFLNERKPFMYEEDIKPICSSYSSELPPSIPTTPIFPGVPPTEQPLWASTFRSTPVLSGDSWVSTIFNEYFPDDKYKVSDTGNYAWLKPKPITYPSGRVVDQTKILSLLNYMAENANTKETEDSKPRADFFFWKDLKSTNFMSITDMIKKEPKANYSVLARDSYDSDAFSERREKIDNITFYPSFSLMELENSGAFSSYYERVEPNLENPYFSYSDYGVGILRKNIIYKISDYFPSEFYNFYETGVANQFEASTQEIIKGDQISLEYFDARKGITLNIYTKRMYDDNKFGYFDYSYFNSYQEEPAYSFHTEQGITVDELKGERCSQLMWQTMFDIDEFDPVVGGTGLSGSNIPVVNDEPLIIGTQQILGLDGNIFSNTSSTNPNPNKNIAKVIIKLKKDSRDKRAAYLALRRIKEKWNIFKYVICCIDTNTSFWALITGASAITGATQTTAYSKAKAYRYSWQEVEFFPEMLISITGISGTTCIPCSEILGSSGCTVCNYSCTGGTFGFTGMEYEYLESHPGFKVVSYQWGRSGGYTQGFEAYNINEIMNFESADKEYAGPGSNMKASGYPQGFKNQAVGHHPNTNNPCVSNIHGQIVRMYQIEIHDVRGLSYCPEQLKLTPYFYYFDVQNDKEGDCEAC
jgi:hypothetical protein